MIRITKRLVHREHMALEPFKPPFPVCACVISLLLLLLLLLSLVRQLGEKRMVDV